MTIPFNKPYMTGKELSFIAEAHFNEKLAGDGPFTTNCHEWLENRTGANKALLTHSCTAALEMAAVLADIQPGDEVIMPSFTFVSTANAFVLRGGVPVFVDIRSDTLNIDETLIEAAISPRTKAIVPVHYAGVGCDMDVIMDIAERHNLIVIEDAAQGVMSSYNGKSLGAIGHLGCFSFHETKNIISFFRGQVDKYSWVDIGSSYLPGEIVAAFLWAQMQEAEAITSRRLEIWRKYHRELESLENFGAIRRPIIPANCTHNAHMYYILLPDNGSRTDLISSLRTDGINSVFHYIPLHSSPAGLLYSSPQERLPVTEDLSQRLLRLPFWCGLEEHQDKVIDSVISSLG